MDNELIDIITKNMDAKTAEADSFSPLVLAYVGDSIYDLVIKTSVTLRANRQVEKIHKDTSELVSARAQSEMILGILDDLSEEEVKIFKRGRNTRVVTKARNATMGEYKNATGFETLIGYMYLSGSTKRMFEIIKMCLSHSQNESESQDGKQQ